MSPKAHLLQCLRFTSLPASSIWTCKCISQVFMVPKVSSTWFSDSKYVCPSKYQFSRNFQKLHLDLQCYDILQVLCSPPCNETTCARPLWPRPSAFWPARRFLDRTIGGLDTSGTQLGARRSSPSEPISKSPGKTIPSALSWKLSHHLPCTKWVFQRPAWP